VIRAIRKATGTGAARHPVTLLVEASDDIVYATVDLEDGIKKRLLTWERLEHELCQRAKDCEHAKKALDLAKEKIGPSMRGFAREDALVQAFRTYAIGEAVPSVFDEFKKNYESIMAGNYHDELIAKCSAAALINACKAIAHELIYQSDEILRVELMGRRVIQDLLSMFWEAASNHRTAREGKGFAGKAYELSSSNYRHIFDSALSRRKANTRAPNIAPEEYYELQLVCDYIAGMTDTFAVNLHKKLTNG
jgi:dGTPase